MWRILRLRRQRIFLLPRSVMAVLRAGTQREPSIKGFIYNAEGMHNTEEAMTERTLERPSSDLYNLNLCICLLCFSLAAVARRKRGSLGRVRVKAYVDAITVRTWFVLLKFMHMFIHST
jgi:hypothetical protein